MNSTKMKNEIEVRKQDAAKTRIGITPTPRGGYSFSEYTTIDLTAIAQRLRRKIRSKSATPRGAYYIHICEGRVSLRVNFITAAGVADFQSVAI